ncbi:MAG: hypothetical protein R6X16_12670 [Anaerolineae bacterium]
MVGAKGSKAGAVHRDGWPGGWASSWHAHVLSLAVFLASLAILYGWHHTVTAARFGLTGDEPHYILIAHSLATDGDLDLRNNYAEGDADAWFPDLDADQHVNDYCGDGRLIPVHTPGLPLLLLPAHVLLDNPTRAARGTMLLISALTLLEFYLLAAELTGSRGWALAACLVLAASVPMLYLSGQVYPDVAAALAILLAVRAVGRLPSLRWTVVLALTICFLPFVHVRYIPVSLILGGTALLRLRRLSGLMAMRIFLALCLVGGAGFVLFYVSSYGNPLSNAQYGHLSSAATDWGRLPAITIGLLFEREVGIVPVAPFLLLSIVGGAAALVAQKRLARLAVALAGAYILVLALALAAGVADWGWSLPWRFMLPVYPLMAVVALYAVHRYPLTRWLAVPLVLAGLLIGLLSVRWPGGFYWRNAGVLAMPALDRGQGYLPSEEYAAVTEVPATAGVTTTHERPFGEDPGPVCAIAGEAEAGFLSWGIRKGMLPGETRVSLLVNGEVGASGESPGQVRVVDERTDHALQTHDITAEDLVGGDWKPISFTVESSRAKVLMAVVTYTGEGTLCLEKVAYTQSTLTQRDYGYWPALVISITLAGMGLWLGLTSWRGTAEGASRPD